MLIGKMLILGEIRLKVYENSLYYSCRFSESLKLNKSLKINVCWIKAWEITQHRGNWGAFGVWWSLLEERGLSPVGSECSRPGPFRHPRACESPGGVARCRCRRVRMRCCFSHQLRLVLRRLPAGPGTRGGGCTWGVSRASWAGCSLGLSGEPALLVIALPRRFQCSQG